MAFALPSALNWLEHRFRAFKRAIFRREKSHFIDQYSNVKLIPLTDLDGGVLLCPICGFFMAELEQDWSTRACSATGFRGIFANTRLDAWRTSLIRRFNSSKAAVNNNLSISLK